MTAPSRPRTAALPRATAMRLAATEYERFAELLRSLRPKDWAEPTVCPGWDVRATAAHALGMVEMAAGVISQQLSIGPSAPAGQGRFTRLTPAVPDMFFGYYAPQEEVPHDQNLHRRGAPAAD